MPRFDYQYEPAALRRPGSGSGRGRLILIAVVIAAITGGLLYLLIPAETGKPPATPPGGGLQTEMGAAAGDSAAPPAGDADPAGPDSESASGVSTEPDPGSGELPPEEPAADSGVPSASEAQDSPASELTPSPDLPRKDQPWSGDPPDDGPVVPPDSGNPAVGEAIKKAEAALAAGEWAEASGAASGILRSEPLNSGTYRAAARILTEANRAAFMAGFPADSGAREHRVVSGDNLSRLAAKYDVSIESLRRVNQLKSSVIRVGQALSVHPGPWRITVEKDARLLKLFNGESDVPFLVFDIGIGRLGKTPSADFTICAKVRHPDWYAPDGGVYKYGDPDNVLGDYFLKLAPAGSPGRPLLGYGIHGTRDESSVSRSLSNGCIRMRNADVELLYIIVPAGVPVKITD